MPHPRGRDQAIGAGRAAARRLPGGRAQPLREVAQIAKSLVFRGASSGRAVLVIASGTNRVDEALVAAAIGEAIGKADAAFVRAATGYAIGGVPPLGHAQPIETLFDEDLLRHETVWAAAGTPHAVFPASPAALARATGGRLLRVKAAG